VLSLAIAALYSPGVLGVPLFGFESWCLAHKGTPISLRKWYNKRIRTIFRVAMYQVKLYGITSAELQQKRIGIRDLVY
jgi:hypothetical protein